MVSSKSSVLFIKIIILVILSLIIVNVLNIAIYMLFAGYYSYISAGSVPGDQAIMGMVVGNPLFLACTALANIAFLGILFWVARKVDNLRPINLFINQPIHKPLMQFGTGVLIALVTMVIFVAAGLAAGLFEFSAAQSLQHLDIKMAAFLGCGIIFSLITGFYEEILFRGYILNRLLKWKPAYALWLSALIFIVPEMMNNFYIADILGIFLTGMLFGYLYIITGSIFVSAGIHSTLHFLLLNVVAFQKYDYGLPSLFVFHSEYAYSFIGTPTGICTAFVNAVSLAVLYVYNKKRNGALVSKAEVNI
ncbi:CPBP family intramembrane glutamic endopeptidase [Paenibacillus dauci]|uniref:CPBP family intramembrane glutamic endopeptidase n=1 Tax=Paenibacillus dauci TaxID=1567106 RepID=UPI000A9BA008|nr:type II CAAX endopeptidase family protein [Paenibacillus dauci]